MSKDDTRVTVGHIMSRDPVAVDTEATIEEAWELMTSYDIRHVPVTGDEGRLLGIVSDRDIRSFMLPREEELDRPAEAAERWSSTVLDICNTDMLTVLPSTQLIDAVDMMIEQKVGVLPVVDENSNKLLGIVSYIDVLKMAREFV